MGHGGGGETYAGTSNARPLTLTRAGSLDSSAGVIGRGQLQEILSWPWIEILAPAAAHRPHPVRVFADRSIDRDLSGFLFFPLSPPPLPFDGTRVLACFQEVELEYFRKQLGSRSFIILIIFILFSLDRDLFWITSLKISLKVSLKKKLLFFSKKKRKGKICLCERGTQQGIRSKYRRRKSSQIGDATHRVNR